MFTAALTIAFIAVVFSLICLDGIHAVMSRLMNALIVACVATMACVVFLPGTTFFVAVLVVAFMFAD